MKMTIRTLRSITLAGALLLAVSSAVAAPTIEAGFSPEGSALRLILGTIGDARQNIRLMGYSFTSPEVVKALTDAKRRGVDVKVVLDEKGNSSKASVAAMNLLVNADIPVRTVNRFKIMHDKVLIVDNHTVEVGSFNFSRAAARSNSENALVVREMPELAQTYLAHWQSRWDLGTDWKSSY
jgi:phosphatidylserine/phosphatidylglycerophosphate/cardiolipin synthase-like enzyme